MQSGSASIPWLAEAAASALEARTTHCASSNPSSPCASTHQHTVHTSTSQHLHHLHASGPIPRSPAHSAAQTQTLTTLPDHLTTATLQLHQQHHQALDSLQPLSLSMGMASGVGMAVGMDMDMDVGVGVIRPSLLSHLNLHLERLRLRAAGSSGRVYTALWKGSPCAVKVVLSSTSTSCAPLRGRRCSAAWCRTPPFARCAGA